MSIDDFYNYFQSLQNDLKHVDHTQAEQFCSFYNFNTDNGRFEELDSPITTDEIDKAVHRLKRNKSCGCDFLLNEYFIESLDILSPHLLKIFNAILNSGHFPPEWSKGLIVPVFKKNDHDDVRNYRGITLVSCMSKLLTSIQIVV